MRMNNYISFLCVLLNIKIPKVFFKENDKFYDLKNKPINKELFRIESSQKAADPEANQQNESIKKTAFSWAVIF